MRAALRLRSKSGIHRLITGLEERGYIRRLAYRARALEVIRLPNGARLEPGVDAGAAEANVVQFGRPAEQAVTRTRPSPCRCTAVSPPARRSKPCAIIPLRSRCRRICLAAATTTPSRWSATPCVEAGIQDGDLVVIERADGADNGDIVVALIDDSEVTLKRLRCKGQTMALEAANSAIRDPDLRPEPGQGAGSSGRADAPLLSRRGDAGPISGRHRRTARSGARAGGDQHTVGSRSRHASTWST